MDQQQLPGMPEHQTIEELYNTGQISYEEYNRRTIWEQVEKFDPNEVEYPFASYVPFRNMKFKVHKTLPHARSSTRGGAGAIYEMIGGRWVKLEISHGTQILKDYR